MPKTTNKKAIVGWALYDWANSAFAITVLAGLYPIFFKNYWSAGVDAPLSTTRLLTAKIIAGITVALAAPILGAIADHGSAKKKLLIFFTYLGVVMTAGLALVPEGQWPLAAFLYIWAAIGYSGGNIFYDALLLEVTRLKKADVVSSLGYALGYLGGSLLFILNIWMVKAPATFHLADKAQAVKVSFILVGLWWAVFSIPTFLWVKETINPQAPSGLNLIRTGWRQWLTTLREIRKNRTIFLFLLAYWLYIDGVDTIIHVAVDYGKSLHFPDELLITALLVTNLIGFPAALAFGVLGEKIGAKRGIFIALGTYLFVTIWGAFLNSKWDFYFLAVIIGLVQGGIQSLSRSYFARLIPRDKAAEFFGFYNMLGKFAAIFGLALMAGVILAVRALGYSTIMQTRMSITSISLLFLAGGIILYQVKKKDKTVL